MFLDSFIVNKENATDQKAEYQSYTIQEIKECSILVQKVGGYVRRIFSV